MKSNISNEYYKRKLIQAVKDSRLYSQNFDETFTALDNKNIYLKFERWFVIISDKRQVAYTCGNSFDDLLTALDREINFVEDGYDEGIFK